jgi:hypothetical protein
MLTGVEAFDLEGRLALETGATAASGWRWRSAYETPGHAWPSPAGTLARTGRHRTRWVKALDAWPRGQQPIGET